MAARMAAVAAFDITMLDAMLKPRLAQISSAGTHVGTYVERDMQKRDDIAYR